MESKFKINSIKLMCVGCYNLDKNIDCTICRCNLNANSLHNKKSESTIVIGGCDHAFHEECITPWVKTHPNCPICSNKWIIKTTLN